MGELCFWGRFLHQIAQTQKHQLLSLHNGQQFVNTGDSYLDPGADFRQTMVDPDPTVLVSGEVDPNIPGMDILTYTADDASGNTSAPLTQRGYSVGNKTME